MVGGGSGFSGFWKVIVPVFGIALAASLSFVYGQETAKRKTAEDQKVAAYLQFIESKIAWSVLRGSGNTQRVLELDALHSAARFRMAAFGSEAILRALTHMERAQTGTDEWKRATVVFFHALRDETIAGREPLADETLSKILFP